MAQPSSNRSIYLPDDHWAWAERLADETGLSVNGVMRQALRHYQLKIDGPVELAPKWPPPTGGVALLGGPREGMANPVVPAEKIPSKPAAGFGPVAAAPGSRLKKPKNSVRQ